MFVVKIRRQRGSAFPDWTNLYYNNLAFPQEPIHSINAVGNPLILSSFVQDKSKFETAKNLSRVSNYLLNQSGVNIFSWYLKPLLPPYFKNLPHNYLIYFLNRTPLNFEIDKTEPTYTCILPDWTFKKWALSKSQLISKQICCKVTSPKKGSAFSSFFGRSYSSTTLFSFSRDS